jgi:hypothetical protein
VAFQKNFGFRPTNKSHGLYSKKQAINFPDILQIFGEKIAVAQCTFEKTR